MSSSLYTLLADFSVIAHVIWLVFVIFGAFFLYKRKYLRLVHIGCVLYGVGIEVFQWWCPLTTLERHFRSLAGKGFYETSFISHYLHKIVYVNTPQWMLIAGALLVLGVSSGIYLLAFLRRNRR